MAVRRKMLEEFKEVRALDYWEVEAAMNRMDGNNTTRDRALIAFLFLTGCRISEVVKYNKDGKLEGLPLTKRQIEITDDFITIHDVRTLKRRKKANRTIPIMATNTKEQPFINALSIYMDKLGDDQPLFNITSAWAYMILEKVGLFPHLLRHSRSTILMRNYGLREDDLRRFNGWADTRSVSTYVHLNIEDLKKRMKESQQ